MRKPLIALVTLLFAAVMLSAQQRGKLEEIRLYEGKAPGSEEWDWKPMEIFDILFNVVDPTLTVYPAENPNGTGIILCPGGAFHMLCVKPEGEQLARELNKRGFTCFVLKYRIHKMEANTREMMNTMDLAVMDSLTVDIVPKSLQDALTAVRYVRENAVRYGIAPDRIGIEGSSTGGTVAIGAAMSAPDKASLPDFVAGTYPYYSKWLGNSAPISWTPLFLAAASDDESVPVQSSLDFYTLWMKAGFPVEMHLYKEGGHGFVSQEKGLPVEKWVDTFENWLKTLFP